MNKRKYVIVDGKEIEVIEPREFDYTEEEFRNLTPINFVIFHTFLIKVDNPDRWNRYLKYLKNIGESND